MVRGDKSFTTPVDFKAFELKGVIEVEMIQVQHRLQTGIGSTKLGEKFTVHTLEVLRHQA